MKYDEIFEINGNKLTKKYIEGISKEERLALIEPIFNLLRGVGWIYPDDIGKVKKEYKRLLAFNPDLNNIELYNNSSLATVICKHFCKKFYLATEHNKKNMIEIFNDDKLLKKMIHNRLGLDWIDDDERGKGVNEAFNLSFKMMVQAQRSMRLVTATSIFKPDIAKYMCCKYSEPGDTVFDYSAGWGARMLGAASSGRKYIGVDPWTIDELEEMAKYLELKDIQLIKDGSENVRLTENSMDLAWSSPPYITETKSGFVVTEKYSDDISQAYNKGSEYFFNTYWRNTLKNVKYMLKPGKWFGLNVKGDPRMVDIAKEEFGEVIEKIGLLTVKSHLTKSKDNISKLEYIYMFKNNK